MNIESKLSGHWTDEQLIASIYDAGPEDGHAAECVLCQARLVEMKAVRELTERAAGVNEVPADFLQAQRRKIYGKVTGPVAWWSALWPVLQVRHWVPGTAALLLLGGCLFVYEHNQPRVTPRTTLSDAQLAQDVSQMSGNDESLPTAPLQALFQ